MTQPKHKIHLVTFANKEPFYKSQRILDQTFAKSNISTHTRWVPHMLTNTEFYEKNKYLFERYKSIGFGLFIWKPYIIYQKMLEIPDGEFVYYQDSSRYDFEGLNQDMMPICDYMIDSGIDLIPGFIVDKINKYLISNECAKYMGVFGDEVFMNKNHIQTSPIIIMKNDKTIGFIKEWLTYCQIHACILKTSNVHQCDQAVLNILMYKHGYQGIIFVEDKNDSKKYSLFWKMLFEHISELKG